MAKDSLPFHRWVEDDEFVDPTFREDKDIEKKVKQLGSMLHHFRSRWKHEYLTSLHGFHKTTSNNNQIIAVGDVVLVHDDCKRIYWKLAIIESLIYGKDNLVRAVNIRTVNGTTNQAITKLYPLEVRASSEFCDKETTTNDRDKCESTGIEESEESEYSVNRSQRDSTRRARIYRWCSAVELF